MDWTPAARASPSALPLPAPLARVGRTGPKGRYRAAQEDFRDFLLEAAVVRVEKGDGHALRIMLHHVLLEKYGPLGVAATARDPAETLVLALG